MDTRQVVARFEAERQALALMDHPHIAQVHDGGETASGRPYFVMELVKGVPITEYCDQNQVPIRQRLELFLSVCAAVQHAHQKGIIHRDLKPSNVLVTSHDGTPSPYPLPHAGGEGRVRGVVKVIDFGVAKAVGQQLTDKTVYTHFAQLIGTPLYMAPEQAGESGLDVDTRSDIYSLGVLLYELLTGTTPFDKERLRQVGIDEMRRIIREEEPPRPSTRISTLGQAATAVSAQRKSDPKRLSQLCRGELDWIVMKALEKDRNRRYETASSFAADVQRYLNDEPVQACPPSAWYRFRKFARRNKAALATATVLALAALLAGGGLLWLQGQRVARDRDVSLYLEEAEQWERQGNWPKALRALERAEGRLAGGGPAPLQRRADQVREHARFVRDLEECRLLSSLSEERFDDRQEHRPYAEAFNNAGADRAYAEAFQNRDWDIQARAAEEIAEQIAASPIRRQLVAALDHWAGIKLPKDVAGREKLGTIARLADDDVWLGQLRDPKVRKDRAALERLAREERVLDQPPANLVLLAHMLARRDAGPAVLDLLRRAQRRHPDDFWLNVVLGDSLHDAKKWDDAVAYYRAALALRPKTAAVYHNLANVLKDKGQLDEAIREYRTAIDLDRKLALPHNNLGNALQAKGDLAGAIAYYKKAIALDPKRVFAHINLGAALHDKGDLAGAIAAYKQALALDPKYAPAHNNLGAALYAKKDLAGAIAEFKEAIAEFKEAIAHGPKQAKAHYNLGNVLKSKGDLAGAIAEWQKASVLDPKNASAHFDLGCALKAKGRLDEAIREYRAALALVPKDTKVLVNLGAALYAKGDLDGAIAAFKKAIAFDPKLAQAHYNLGNALADKHDLAGAIAAFKEAIALDAKLAQPHNNLGIVLREKGQLD
jgi:tetratricopeptide (TPR) repeat protein